MAPLTPVDSDLRDFPYMPVDVVRLFGSAFHASATDDAWRAGVTLWFKAWHQVPAGSLPDDDTQLARLAELGRDVKGWKKLKDQALHGWQRCDDGRLYHRVVAEKVLEAWLEKLRQRLASGSGNASRWKTPFDPAPIEAEIDAACGMLTALAPNSRALARAKRKQSRRDPDGIPTGTPGGIPTGNPVGTPTGNPESIPVRSQGRGRKKEVIEEEDSVADATAATSAAAVVDDPGKSLFDRGVELLTAKGKPVGSARSLIARLQRDHGNGPVLNAIERCRSATDPGSAMIAMLGKAKAQQEYLGV